MPKKKRAGDVTTVGLVQMSCDQKPETNLKKAIAGINDAAKRGAQIVCLQELFRSQYFCQTKISNSSNWRKLFLDHRQRR